jgi:hypothetical protein
VKVAHWMLPEGDWNGVSVVTCCPAGIVAGVGATVTVTGGGAVTVTVVIGVAGVAGGGATVDIEITGVSLGVGGMVALVDGAHAASAIAASAKTYTPGRRAIDRGASWPITALWSCEFSVMSFPFRWT